MNWLLLSGLAPRHRLPAPAPASPASCSLRRRLRTTHRHQIRVHRAPSASPAAAPPVVWRGFLPNPPSRSASTATSLFFSSACGTAPSPPRKSPSLIEPPRMRRRASRWGTRGRGYRRGRRRMGPRWICQDWTTRRRIRRRARAGTGHGPRLDLRQHAEVACQEALDPVHGSGKRRQTSHRCPRRRRARWGGEEGEEGAPTRSYRDGG